MEFKVVIIYKVKRKLLMNKKDFETKQDVRWCPGCGDYAILATLQRTLPDLGIDQEKIVFVSGIGCASRLPYYMNTYGFHTIHGRALPIATGIKLMRPDLTVFVVGGDGDMLSIGLSHLMHTMRRNVDLNILLLNNHVYGLTKGQNSPTTNIYGDINTENNNISELPIDAVSIAKSVNCSFIAKCLDTDSKNLSNIIKESVLNKGTSLIEISQHCPIYNKKQDRVAETMQVKAEIIQNNPRQVFNFENSENINKKDINVKNSIQELLNNGAWEV